MSQINQAVDVIEPILEKYNYDKSQLIAILQDVQAEYKYLPRETLLEISRSIGIPVSKIYQVATFFRAFSLKPKGRHCMHVCMGTACHVRGAASILKEMENKLGIDCGETTSDNKYTLDRVNCVGACALGPVVVVDGKYVGQMNISKVKQLLESCE